MGHQKYKLKDIAIISSGYSFRTKIQNNPNGNTYVIQMRDISNDRTGIIDKPHKVDSEKINKKHILQKGDILFTAKGANNFAVYYNEQYKPAIAASAFFVLRSNVDFILPSYLCWYINSPKAQAFIESNRAGSYIPNVNKAVLDNLDIIVPPLETQNTIAELYKLSKKEEAILDKIKDKCTVLINSILSNLITKNHGN
ncbi:MAG: restriction endonuclease subunit S [Bacteroidales bacterium]|nr:restriction endonuclease subunit S [Bacteroidales bacterium]